MADFKAASSLAKSSSPAEAHMPRSRVVLVLMAAGMASMGVFVVPPCCVTIRVSHWQARGVSVGLQSWCTDEPS